MCFNMVFNGDIMTEQINKLQFPDGKLYKVVTPPTPNMKVMFGEDSWTFLQYYCKSPPNRVQRWLIKKVFGIKIELL